MLFGPLSTIRISNHSGATMIRRPLVVGGIAAIAAIVFVAADQRAGARTHSGVLHALAVDPFQDTDGDLLPDSVEWVVLSDPSTADTDGDGRDDFIEAVQYTSMRSATPPQAVDQEMRVLLSSLVDRYSGERYVWLHCLFRFASGRVDLDWFMPFLSTGREGLAVPIGDIVGRTPMRLSVRGSPNEGAYAIVTLRLARERDFVHTLPCMVNARACISGRFLAASTYVFASYGTLSTLVPLGRDSAQGQLIAQSLAAHDGSSNTFFSGNRVCVQTLGITGQVPGGYLCEVESSTCEPANGLRCSSDCSRQVGETLIAPDGLGAITGG
jgi:hypothetical protein